MSYNREDYLKKRIMVTDLDGTLIDSADRHVTVMEELLWNEELQYTDDIKAQFDGASFMDYKASGKSGRDYLTDILGLTPDCAKRISEKWKDKVEQDIYLSEDKLYADSINFLNTFFSECGVVFLTARRNRGGLEGELKRLNILGFADYVIVADPAKAAADKEKAVTVLKKEYPDAEIFIVGDTENEFELSVKTGYKAFILNRGFRNRAFWEAKNVKNYDGLDAVIKDIRRAK